MSATKRIEHIDVWRFFAVILVIQEHFLLFSGIDRYIADIETYSLQIERFGEMGVLIFFSISGFVICNGLNSEKNTTGKICLSAFCARRFFRIVPPMWLYLLTLFILNSADLLKISGEQLLTSAAFLCNLPLTKGCSWYAGHTWSLAYEEQFYLLFPLLFIWAWRGNRNGRIFASIALLTSIALILHYSGKIFWSQYCTYFLFLFMGCFSALLPFHWMKRLRNLSLLEWSAATILLMGLLTFLPTKQDAVFKILLYPLLVQIIVFGTPTHFPKMKTLFHHPKLSYLGRISYSVYLWQELATAYYTGVQWWQTLIYLGIVFGFSSLSFTYFEQPCLRFGTSLSNKLKARVI